MYACTALSSRHLVCHPVKFALARSEQKAPLSPCLHLPLFSPTQSGLGANHTTGMAGAPMAGEMGTHNRGMGGGMGGDLVTNSVSSSSSSDSDIGERGVGIGGAGVAHNVAGNTVCETRTFTEVEDRPIMRERVERIIEHR